MPTVRAARPADAPALARVHVLAWQETYRGLMDDAVLDAERLLAGIYLLRAWHGSGAGQELLDAVLGPDETAVLWVADPNPRARRFYERAGFRADGTTKEDDGVHELRMVRP